MPKTVCSYCGQENDASARFCSDCGKPLLLSGARVQPAYTPTRGSGALTGGASQQRCRKCSQLVDGGMSFCGHCGTKVVDQIEEGGCKNCGAKYVKGSDLFCAQCGTRVGERVSQTAVLGSNARASGARIAILDERGEPSKIFLLDRNEAVIGRGDADIQFESDVYLSPLHARIDLNEGSLWLRDLGSRNGSWVFIDEPTKLIDGDLILIGSQVLRFRRLGYPGPHHRKPIPRGEWAP